MENVKNGLQNDNSVHLKPKSPDSSKPDLRSYKTIEEHLWLRLVRLTNREGDVRYGLTFYRTGNLNKPKTIAYMKNEAYQIWNELKAQVFSLESDHDKEQWIETRVVPPPRKTRRSKEILYEFGDRLLSRQLEKHCKEYCQRRIERSSKTARVKLCRELAALAAPDEKLNARIVNAYFKQRMTPENHDSPDTKFR